MNEYTCKKDKNNIKIVLTIVLQFIGAYIMINSIYSSMDKIDIYQPIILIIQIILIYYLSILLHETGHFIMYKLYNYNIKIIIIGPIIISFDRQIKIKCKINPLIMAGLVQPSINENIVDEKSLNEFTDNLIKILYGGIIVSILLLIVSIILITDKNLSQIGKIMFMINLYSVVGCFLNCGHFTGDFKLIQIIKNNYKDILKEFSNNFRIEFPVSEELRELMKEYCVNCLKEKKYDYKLLNNIIIVLQYNIIFNEDIDDEIMKFIIWFENSLIDILQKSSLIEKHINMNFYNNIKIMGLASTDITDFKYNKSEVYDVIFYESFEGYREMKLILDNLYYD